MKGHRRQKSGPPPQRDKIPRGALDLSETQTTPKITSTPPVKTSKSVDQAQPGYGLVLDDPPNGHLPGHRPPPKRQVSDGNLSPHSANKGMGGLPRPPSSPEETSPSPPKVEKKSSATSVMITKANTMPTRNALMAGIAGFSANKLKKVDTSQLQEPKTMEKAQDVNTLLQDTLKNYRQFVMDDDDSDDSDEEWDD